MGSSPTRVTMNLPTFVTVLVVAFFVGCDTRSPQKVNDDRINYLTWWLGNFGVKVDNVSCISMPSCTYRCTVGSNNDGIVKLYKVICVDGFCTSRPDGYSVCELEAGSQ